MLVVDWCCLIPLAEIKCAVMLCVIKYNRQECWLNKQELTTFTISSMLACLPALLVCLRLCCDVGSSYAAVL